MRDEGARSNAEERLLDLLLPPHAPVRRRGRARPRGARAQAARTRERLREQLRAGRLDDRIVEIDVRESSFPSFEIIAGRAVEEIDINLKDMLPGALPGQDQEAQASRCPRRSST